MSSTEAVIIRNAEPEDLGSIIQILAEDTLGKTREKFSHPLPASYVEAFIEIQNSGFNEILVACLKEEIIAVCQVTYIPNLTFQGGRRAQIEGVRVDSAHQSKGVGKKLINEAIDRARKSGCKIVQLTSNKSRLQAIRFYESLGFESTHEGMKIYL